MSTTSLYNTQQQTGTVSSENLTSLYSNTSNFTTGLVNSTVYSVNGGLGVTVNPTTGNVVVSIGQAVAPTDNVTFANITATGNLSNNYYTLANAIGTSGQVLTTNGAGATAWTSVSGLGLVNSVSGSGAGITVSPTTGDVVVTNTGVTSIIAGTNITVSSATGAVTINAAGSGDVVGPSSSTDNALARYDGTTGKLIQNSSAILTDTGDLTLAGDLVVTGRDISTGITNGFMTISQLTSSTDVPQNGVRITVESTGTPQVGLGTNLEFAIETQPSVITLAGAVQVESTDITPGAESFKMDFDLTSNGVSQTRMSLNDQGSLNVVKNLTVDSGTLFVDATNNRVGINNNNPQYELHIDQGLDGFTQLGMSTIERTMILTMNDGNDLLSLNYGTVNRLEFSDATGNQWFNSGYLGVNTNTPAYNLDVAGDGRFTQSVITSALKVVGATNGYSNFIAPTTGSNLNYTLPSTGGAANTVLTNDGSGNLSWALPGGGGSTFGNVTVGVVTDNTISTTTGNLVLASATNVIDANSAEIQASLLTVDNRSSIETTTITTTSTATVSLMSTGRNVMSVLVNILQGSNVHCVNATVLRNGATAMLTTYGEMYNTTPLANFTADISGGNIRLLVTPTSATSTVFSAVRTSLT